MGPPRGGSQASRSIQAGSSHELPPLLPSPLHPMSPASAFLANDGYRLAAKVADELETVVRRLRQLESGFPNFVERERALWLSSQEVNDTRSGTARARELMRAAGHAAGEKFPVTRRADERGRQGRIRKRASETDSEDGPRPDDSHEEGYGFGG